MRKLSLVLSLFFLAAIVHAKTRFDGEKLTDLYFTCYDIKNSRDEHTLPDPKISVSFKMRKDIETAVADTVIETQTKANAENCQFTDAIRIPAPMLQITEILVSLYDSNSGRSDELLMKAYVDFVGLQEAAKRGKVYKISEKGRDAKCEIVAVNVNKEGSQFLVDVQPRFDSDESSWKKYENCNYDGVSGPRFLLQTRGPSIMGISKTRNVYESEPFDGTVYSQFRYKSFIVDYEELLVRNDKKEYRILIMCKPDTHVPAKEIAASPFMEVTNVFNKGGEVNFEINSMRLKSHLGTVQLKATGVPHFSELSKLVNFEVETFRLSSHANFNPIEFKRDVDKTTYQMESYAANNMKLRFLAEVPVEIQPGSSALSQAIRQAVANAITPPNGLNSYRIIRIFIDYEFDEYDQATKDAIVEASQYAISIVIIGVGGDDFTKFELLDGDDNGYLKDRWGKRAARDIVNFVQLNDFSEINRQLALGPEVMKEIPDNVSQHFALKGISLHRLNEFARTHHQPGGDGSYVAPQITGQHYPFSELNALATHANRYPSADRPPPPFNAPGTHVVASAPPIRYAATDPIGRDAAGHSTFPQHGVMAENANTDPYALYGDPPPYEKSFATASAPSIHHAATAPSAQYHQEIVRDLGPAFSAYDPHFGGQPRVPPRSVFKEELPDYIARR